MLVPLAHADDNGPPGAGQPGTASGGQHGGRPEHGAPGFHLIPRFAEQKMDLSDDQKKQIADLEQQTKAKLAEILTADQMKILNTARPPHPGGGGGGGGGGQGNQGGGSGGPPQGN